MKMYMQAPFVCSFIFSFFSMLGMKDKPSTGLRRRIFMAEVEVIKAVEGPILRNGNSVVPNAKEWFKAEKSAIQPA